MTGSGSYDIFAGTQLPKQMTDLVVSPGGGGAGVIVRPPASMNLELCT
jgi:hypothetical protein